MNQSKKVIGSMEYTVKGYLLGILVIIVSLIFASVGAHASESNNYIPIEGNNYQGDTGWDYEYTGTSQTFTVPVNGRYQIEIYGAQGAGYETHSGGYGGSVIGTVDLNAGDAINIIVGGTDGYNGGGKGVLSNGGGASQISKNGNLLAIAGGGGGATNTADGNAGGSSAGINNNFLDGSDSTAQNSAGGGGGYSGGMNGYTIYHTHSGNEENGGSCFNTPVYHAHEGDTNTGAGCYTQPIYHVHEGNSTYYGGCYTNVNYHVHQGNESIMGGCYSIAKYHTHSGSEVSGGGCYTTPVMHTHSDSCPTRTCTGTSFSTTTSSGSETYYYCDECGFGWSKKKDVCGKVHSTCQKGNTVEYYTLSCEMDDTSVVGYDLGCGKLTSTPESYSLGCEKTEESIEKYEIGCGYDLSTVLGYQLSCKKIENESIDDSKAAFGGSNYYDSTSYTNAKSSAGVNAGNGYVKIALIAVDGATVAYYDHNMSLLKKVTVPKGESVSYPFSENPQKTADERYSYSFSGWDNINTEEVEKYTNEETVQDTLSSHSYKAVYTATGQTYTITFDSQGAETTGTQGISVTYGHSMSNIEIPTKNNYIFAGYYSQPQGMGVQYYNSTGAAINNSDITTNTVLYAHWLQPLSIIRQPMDIILTTGYKGIVLELDTTLTASGNFAIEYQWYLNSKTGNVQEIVDGTSKNLVLPENYTLGEYSFVCKATVTDNTNQHQFVLYSDTADVSVVKGNLSDKQLRYEQKNLIYDGKYHAAVIEVDIPNEYSIYYSLDELNQENYMIQGSTRPLNFINAEKTKIYYYITSSDYEDYAGSFEYEIQKAKPEILILSKNVSYTGETKSIDEAKLIGVNNEILSNADVSYIYYTDEACTVKTSKEDGAIIDGASPSKVGSYYVKAYFDGASNYTAVSTTTPVLLNILRTTVGFEIKGYIGVYDNIEHGIIADDKGNDNISFYYSTDSVLTAQNYIQNGNTESPLFKNAGTYKVYYLVVNKLTGKLNSYIPGDVTVTIYKAQQYITNKNRPWFNTGTNKMVFPNGGEWEYKKANSNAGWIKYEDEEISLGVYEFRLMESENYYASDSVIIQVKAKDNSNGNGTDNDTNTTDKEEVIPESESTPIPKPAPEIPNVEEEKSEIPTSTEDINKENNEKEESSNIHDNNNKEENSNIHDNINNEEISDATNQNDITNRYEQDLNGNGIPDIFETDNNGNGILDYFEWDMNGNGIIDYLEDENGNGIPDFLEWQETVEELIVGEKEIMEIEEVMTPLDIKQKQSLFEKVIQAVKNIISEENVKIVVPCVTVGMVIGLFISYLVLVLLAPLIKSKTKYRYYIQMLLSGKAQRYKISINTDLARVDSSRAAEGIHFFRQLCTNEDYILTIKDKNNYSVGVVKLTFMKGRVFHEIIINQGIEIRVEQQKHGAKVYIN